MSKKLTKKELEELTRVKQSPVFKIAKYMIWLVLFFIGMCFNALTVWIVFKIFGVL